MLNPILPGQFISRVFTDQSGQQFRLTFFVTIVDGEARGHLVSVQPINAKRLEIGGSRLEKNIFCLPCASTSLKSPISNLQSPGFLVSPFTELFFFMSQPTRAPSRR